MNPTDTDLIATLQKWQESLAEEFFDLDDAGDARQFADAMHAFLPAILAALKQGKTDREQRDELAKEVERLKGLVAKYETRLEIDHAFELKREPGSDAELVQFELTPEERAHFPDAVECRDATIHVLESDLETVRTQRDKLQAFKTWVHQYLDAAGVPHHPPGTHGAEGCRIGDRMDWLMAQLAEARAEVDALNAKYAASLRSRTKQRERAEQAETQRDELAKALEPFAEAVNFENTIYGFRIHDDSKLADYEKVWGKTLTCGHVRRAAEALAKLKPDAAV